MSTEIETVISNIIATTTICVILSCPFWLIPTIYCIKSINDTSVGTVVCDGKPVYSGRLYRVEERVLTQNLQAPVFKVYVKEPTNVFKTELKVVCMDYRIVKD